jgi:hypothetical protein
MDAIDLKILALLQTDATLSIAQIGERVGLSQTPCWKPGRWRRTFFAGRVQSPVRGSARDGAAARKAVCATLAYQGEALRQAERQERRGEVLRRAVEGKGHGIGWKAVV